MQYLMEQFKLYNPELVDRIIESYAVSPFRLKCILDDGSTVIFNSQTGDLRTYAKSDGSEEDWRRRFRHCLFDTLAEKCITQKELSERTGISTTMFVHYMKGRNSPNGYNLSRIADALDCGVDDLLY